MGVDIIVPIYNAYEDLCKCLTSIYRNTSLVENRLILINDNSSDERVKPLLDKQTKDNVIVLHNNKNKGFSENINIGMDQSESNDVILLNSDTVVTRGWLDKMVSCAYSNEVIGTVTPLSNNATLCSVPVFCEENELPENMTIDQVADIVERCSLEKYPRITVANGFCMLIKREVINTVGKFDAETFGRGYGEENDFCNRAEQMGYIHVMCDNTYIYHSGTKSFVSAEKMAFIAKHEGILNERYPEQMHSNECYCRDNPNGWIGYNVDVHLDINNGKKNILYVLQSHFESDDSIGGTQIHVKQLVNGLKNKMNLFVAAREGSHLTLSVYVNDRRHIFRFWIGEKPGYPVIRNRELADAFANILEGFDIDLVHVHHTMSTSLDIFAEANKRKIPVIYSVHDFYCVCPNQTLTNNNSESCIGRKNLVCRECLNTARGVYEGIDFLEKWRMEYRRHLNCCRLIIAPSESVKRIINQYYPEIDGKIMVIEHGIEKGVLSDEEFEQADQMDQLKWKVLLLKHDSGCYFIAVEIAAEVRPEKVIFRATDKSGKKMYLPSNFGTNQFFTPSDNQFYGFIPSDGLADGKVCIDVLIRKEDRFFINEEKKYFFDYSSAVDSKKLKVAFLGGINRDKGSEVIAELIQKKQQNIEWYLFGGIGDEKLYNLKKNNFIKTSFYCAEDIGRHLKNHGIDIVCLPSKVPETFSYTLSEAVANGIPVIVTDIGALGERCALHNYGWIVTTDNTADEIFGILENIIADRQIVEERKKHLEIASVKSVSQMVEEYEGQYKLQTNSDEQMPKYLEHKKNMEFLCKANIKSINIKDGTFTDMPNYSKLEREAREYRHLQTTLAYKIIIKYQKMNFPLKELLRKRMMKHIR